MYSLILWFKNKFLSINIITTQRQIVLTSSTFFVSSDVYLAIITTLADGHCDGGTRGDLFGMISSTESVEIRWRTVKTRCYLIIIDDQCTLRGVEKRCITQWFLWRCKGINWGAVKEDTIRGGTKLKRQLGNTSDFFCTTITAVNR